MVYESQNQIFRLKSDLSIVETQTKMKPQRIDTTLTQIAQLEELVQVEKLEQFLVDAAMWSPHISFELQIGDEKLSLEAR